MRFAYIAHPIDQVSDNLVVDMVVSALAHALQVAGIGSYNPSRPWIVGAGMAPGPEIEAVNRAAIDACDVLVAVLPAGTATIGTPMEITAALNAGKPVAVLTDTKSWSIAGIQSRRSRSFSLSRPGVQEAVDWLDSQDCRTEEEAGGGKEVLWTVTGPLYEQGPSRSYPDDAGFDLYVADTTVIHPGTFVDVPTGIAVEMPVNVWGMLTGRSSTLRRRGLLVNQGVIDPGYRGELFSGVWNLTDHEVVVSAGERIAQLILVGNETREHQVRFVPELTSSDRGKSGFGSSGA